MLRSNKLVEVRKPLQENISKRTSTSLRKWWVNISRHFLAYAILYMFFLWIVKIMLSVYFGVLLGFDHTKIVRNAFLTATYYSFALAICPLLYSFYLGKNRFSQTMKVQPDMEYLAVPPNDCNTVSEGSVQEQYRDLLKQFHAKLKGGKDFLWSWVCSLLPALVIWEITSIRLSVVKNWYQVCIGILDALCGYAIILFFFYLLLKIRRKILQSGWYLMRLTEIFDLAMVPNHADGRAGLSMLGKLCTSLLWPIILGLGIAVAYGGYIIHSIIDPKFFRAAGFPQDFSHLVLWHFIIMCSLIVVVYVIPTFRYGIILPALAIHKNMQRQRKKYLVSENKLLQQLYHARVDAIQKNDWKMAKQQQQRFENIKGLYSPLPTWPFKYPTILRALSLTVGNATIASIPVIARMVLGMLKQFIL